MTAIGRAGFKPRSCEWCGFTCWYYPLERFGDQKNWYCTDKCRSASRSQRKRMSAHRVPREPFCMWDVWYRDGFACWICHRAVDFELTEQGPWRATVDHVKRIADGGTHTFENVRLAHARCNEARHWPTDKRPDDYDLAMVA